MTTPRTDSARSSVPGGLEPETDKGVGHAALPAGSATMTTPRWWSRGRSLRIKLAALLVIAVVWELVVALVGHDFMATPTGVLAAIPEVLLRDEILWGAAWETLRLVLLGLAIAVLVGSALGLAMGRVRWVQAAMSPYVNGIYATPMIAVLPVLTLWLGFGVDATFALIVYAALPPMAVAAWDGTAKLPTQFLEVAHTYRAGWKDVWLGIALPSSLPNLIAGFRLASGRALSAVVIAEFLIGTGNGLGIHVMRLAGTFRHDQALVAVLVLALTGLALTVGLERLISRFLPWYREL
jgi:ABC-type nitrate/sulfonate/bicarbonate transport system permease component